MLEPRLDLQEKLITSLEGGSDELPSEVAEMLDPFQYVASANYAMPMLLELAIERSNEIVDAIPRYSSMDHAATWSALVSAMARFEGFKAPYFASKLATDPFAEELLRHESNRLQRHHAVASFKQDLWRLVEDEDGLRIRIAPRARRSALHLVAGKADFLLSEPPVRQLLEEATNETDMESFALAAGTSSLAILEESCPEAWGRMAEELPFRIDLLPHFRAFVIRLFQSGGRWGTRNDLITAWNELATEQTVPQVDRAEAESLIDFHALTLAEALAWGVQSAFIRFDETLAIWPFAFHVLHPDLSFLALLIRRHEGLWSRTVGADLAQVADVFAAEINEEGRFLARARRKRKGTGEVDLAILDLGSGDVLVLELKTVFDKFRTHVQLSNYVEQRVNFPKAIGQARAAAGAIARGDWPLRDLFGKAAPEVPKSVTPGLLTWWDTYNPTLDSSDPISCCNFATFKYLLGEAASLADLVTALNELAHTYCPGALHEGSARIGDGKRIELRREVQTDVLPPVDLRGLGALTRRALADIPQMTGSPDPTVGPAAFVY